MSAPKLTTYSPFGESAIGSTLSSWPWISPILFKLGNFQSWWSSSPWLDTNSRLNSDQIRPENCEFVSMEFFKIPENTFQSLIVSSCLPPSLSKTSVLHGLGFYSRFMLIQFNYRFSTIWWYSWFIPLWILFFFKF